MGIRADTGIIPACYRKSDPRVRDSAVNVVVPGSRPAAGNRMPTGESSCCPIARTVSLIGDRWTPLIVRDLSTGCLRFGELQRSLTGISPKTLSDRLRRLEDAEVIRRACYAEMPPRVEYSLTDKGHALLAVVESMRDFGITWLDDAESPSPPG